MRRHWGNVRIERTAIEGERGLRARLPSTKWLVRPNAAPCAKFRKTVLISRSLHELAANVRFDEDWMQRRQVR